MSPIGKKSLAWNHFTLGKYKTTVTCNICRKQYKFHGNTSNLLEHLKRIHPFTLKPIKKEKTGQTRNVAIEGTTSSSSTVFTEPTTSGAPSVSFAVPSTSKQTEDIDLTLTSTTPAVICRKQQLMLVDGTTSSRNLSEDYINELDKLVVKLVACDYQPLSIVEDKGFKELVSKLNSNYELPSIKTLTHKLIPHHYGRIHTKTLEKLQAIDYIAITTDCWSSHTNKSFISITGHYIYDFVMHSTTLAAREVTVSDNSENTTGQVIREILEEFDVLQKVVIIVTDNATNMKNVVTKELNKHHHPCVAHTVNVTVQDAISSNQNLQTILTKCRNLVDHFKHSNSSYNKLHEKQEELGLPLLNLKQEVSKNWNSTFFMIERLCALKQVIAVTLPELTSTSSPDNLIGLEWIVLEDCLEILRPMFQLTEELSACKYVTLSKIIPLIRGMQHNLLRLETNTDVGKQFRKNLFENIQLRLSSFESNTMASMATFLDPRFKKIAFGVSENAETAEDCIISELATLIADRHRIHSKIAGIPSTTTFKEESSKEKMQEDTIWAQFDEKALNIDEFDNVKPTSSAIVMVKQYAESKLLRRTEDPLTYWKEHAVQFPELAILASKYLCIPATSVDSERLFSKSGYILSDRRSRLGSKKLNEILFLSANM